MDTDVQRLAKSNLEPLLEDPGFCGEFFAYMALCDKTQRRRFLFNAYIPKADGATTEIDIIMLHSSGIFVIESKYYSGWIAGSYRRDRWSQVLVDHNCRLHPVSFRSPLRQNFAHASALRQYLCDWSQVPIYPIVAFSDHCHFMRLEVPDCGAVVHFRALAHTVAELAAKTPQALEEAAAEAIYRKLLPLTGRSQAEKQKHVNRVKEAWGRESESVCG
ncbi:MAG: NERD domain-containing protein [Oscillospiraceae bacterium]|jgi:hypothetical protein|nr:NERD domain-containing protein [Oscillospiraceae bacterium]